MGYDVSNMLGSIESMSIAAQITGQDLATTTDLVTDALSAYHMEVAEMPKFLDVMAKLQASANTNMSQATEAFIWAGGTMAEMNIELEQAGALMGILANQGMKASLAGRSLTSILINLTKESGESYDALQRLEKLTGIKTTAFDEKGNYIGVEKQLYNIKEALSKVNEQERITLSGMIAGKTQKKTFDKLMHGMGDSYENLKTKLQNSDGTLMEMKEIVDESAFAKFKKMLSAIQEAFLQLWEVIQPYVLFFIEKITELANKFSSLTDGQKQHIAKMLVLVALLPFAIKLFGFLIIGIGGVIKTIGFLVLGVYALIKTFVFIGGVIKTVITLFWNFGSFIIGTVLPAIQGLIAMLFGVSLPIWMIVAVIGIVVATVWWMVDSWNEAFDKMANPIENLCNMFKNMGEDINHFFMGLWKKAYGFIGKLRGLSEKEIKEVQNTLLASYKDKDAQKEGYANYKEKKEADKQAKKEAKKQARKDKLNKTIGNVVNGAEKGINGVLGAIGGEEFDLSIDFDDGGLLSGLKDINAEFDEFNAKDKKAKIETEISEFAETKAQLEEVSKTEYKAKFDIATDEAKIAKIAKQIQDLEVEKLNLEINPETNKKRLKKVTSELDKLYGERSLYVSYIEKNKEVLDEAKKLRDELDGSEAEIIIRAQEAGMTLEEYKAKLASEEFVLEHNVELKHENYTEEYNALKTKLEEITNEEYEIKIALGDSTTTTEEAEKLVERLAEIRQEKIDIPIVMKYINETEIFKWAGETKKILEEQLQEVNINLAPYEGMNLEDIETEGERKAVEKWRAEQARLTDEVNKTNTAYENAKKTLEGLDSSTVTKYFDDLDEASKRLEKCAVNAEDEVDTKAKDLQEKIANVKDDVDELVQIVDEDLELNINTETATKNLNKTNKSLETTSKDMSLVNNKAVGFKNAINEVNTSSLTNCFITIANKLNEAREKLISINKIASSTGVVSFTAMGNALYDILVIAREKLSHICGYANNTGVSSMNSMGNALTKSLEGARTKLSNICGYANNTGVNSLANMGNALLNKLNASYNKVRDIANMANSIKVNTPAPSSFAVNSGGRSASIPQAITTTFVMPSANVGSAYSARANSITNNTANVNVNMNGVNTNSRLSANNFYRQLKKNCQRDGLFD